MTAPPLMIQTDRLSLIACDLAHYDAMLDGDDALGRLTGLAVEPDWTGGFDAAVLAGRLRPALANDPARLPWWARLFVHRADRRLIGFGGYKGAPDAEGRVEIGYALAPAYRGAGLARETAAALAHAAFAAPGVNAVIAHTLPEHNASTAVLEAIGLRRDGIVQNPTVGETWRWAVTPEQLAV